MPLPLLFLRRQFATPSALQPDALARRLTLSGRLDVG